MESCFNISLIIAARSWNEADIEMEAYKKDLDGVHERPKNRLHWKRDMIIDNIVGNLKKPKIVCSNIFLIESRE